MSEIHPYKNDNSYEFIRKSLPYEHKIKNHLEGVENFTVRHYRTYVYKTQCTTSERVRAIVLTIFTFGLSLAFESTRSKVFEGKKIVKTKVEYSLRKSKDLLIDQFLTRKQKNYAQVMQGIMDNLHKQKLDLVFRHLTSKEKEQFTTLMSNQEALKDSVDKIQNFFDEHWLTFGVPNPVFTSVHDSIKHMLLKNSDLNRTYLTYHFLNEQEAAYVKVIYGILVQMADEEADRKLGVDTPQI